MGSRKKSKVHQKKSGAQKTSHQQSSTHQVEQLLSLISEEKLFIHEQKFEKAFGSHLEEMEKTLLHLSSTKNNLAILRRIEKELTLLQDQISKATKQKGRKLQGWVRLLQAGKVLLYTGIYFKLIPRQSLEHHAFIYIAAAIILIALWLLYFTLLDKSHTAFFQTVVLPYSKKLPKKKRNQFQLMSVSLFNFIGFSPLLTLFQVFPKFIDPTWDTFLFTLGSIVKDIFTSNAVTAVVNILAFIPLLSFAHQQFISRSHKHAPARQKLEDA